MKDKSFDIYAFLKQRPLSWSALSSFEYDPEQWYETYILGKKQTSKEMDFGSYVDNRFQNDPKFFPELDRGELLQHKMKAVFSGIHLVGIPDILSIKGKKELFDLKTGKKKWDDERARDTGQLTFYLFLIFITYKILPEEFTCGIHWLETHDTGDFKIDFVPNVKPKTFYTTRTTADLIAFGVRIKKTVKSMQEFVLQKSIASNTMIESSRAT